MLDKWTPDFLILGFRTRGWALQLRLLGVLPLEPTCSRWMEPIFRSSLRFSSTFFSISASSSFLLLIMMFLTNLSLSCRSSLSVSTSPPLLLAICASLPMYLCDRHLLTEATGCDSFFINCMALRMDLPERGDSQSWDCFLSCSFSLSLYLCSQGSCSSLYLSSRLIFMPELGLSSRYDLGVNYFTLRPFYLSSDSSQQLSLSLWMGASISLILRSIRLFSLLGSLGGLMVSSSGLRRIEPYEMTLCILLSSILWIYFLRLANCRKQSACEYFLGAPSYWLDLIGISIISFAFFFISMLSMLQLYLDLGSFFFRSFRSVGNLMVFNNSSLACSTSYSIPSSLHFLCITGKFNNCLHDSLCLGFSFTHAPIKSLNYCEQRIGSGSYSPFCTFLNRLSKSLPLNGGRQVHISQRTHPNDQISDLESQGSSLQTQGLAQQGVPVCVYAILSTLSCTFDTLRSPSLYTPSLIKMLALLMSLCSMDLECSSQSPLIVQQAAFHTSFSATYAIDLRWASIFFCRSPSSTQYSLLLAYSITMQSRLSFWSKKASLYWTIYSELSEARILISFKAFCRYFSFKAAILIYVEGACTFLRAQTWSSVMRRTLQTELKLPSPIFSSGMKLTMEVEGDPAACPSSKKLVLICFTIINIIVQISYPQSNIPASLTKISPSRQRVPICALTPHATPLALLLYMNRPKFGPVAPAHLQKCHTRQFITTQPLSVLGEVNYLQLWQIPLQE